MSMAFRGRPAPSTGGRRTAHHSSPVAAVRQASALAFRACGGEVEDASRTGGARERPLDRFLLQLASTGPSAGAGFAGRSHHAAGHLRVTARRPEFFDADAVNMPELGSASPTCRLWAARRSPRTGVRALRHHHEGARFRGVLTTERQRGRYRAAGHAGRATATLHQDQGCELAEVDEDGRRRPQAPAAHPEIIAIRARKAWASRSPGARRRHRGRSPRPFSRTAVCASPRQWRRNVIDTSRCRLVHPARISRAAPRRTSPRCSSIVLQKRGRTRR